MAESETQSEGAAAETVSSSDFSALLQKEFRPKTDQARSDIEMAVRTLAEQALANTGLVSDDALRSIEGMITIPITRAWKAPGAGFIIW